MKRSLSKILARMAKDGDIETVAGIIEEMIEPETEASAEAPESEAAFAIEDPAAVIETEEATVTVDEMTLADVVSRLDRIIALLTPAATDEEPAEKIAEVVEEAIEAAAETPVSTETIEELVEEILEPAVPGTVPGPAPEEDEDPDGQEVLCSMDALRSALKAVRPALMRMPERQRRRVCSDIALRLQGNSRSAADARVYNDMTRQDKPARVSADLGRRIMALRNANRPRG